MVASLIALGLLVLFVGGGYAFGAEASREKYLKHAEEARELTRSAQHIACTWEIAYRELLAQLEKERSPSKD